jgi:hypothetical protein
VERRPGDATEVVADPSFALKDLGWRAERGVKEMAADSWRWQLNNPQGYSVSDTAAYAVDEASPVTAWNTAEENRDVSLLSDKVKESVNLSVAAQT